MVLILQQTFLAELAVMEDIISAAATMGLDTGWFRDSLGNGCPESDLERDIRLAGALGVSGAPTIFVNKTHVTGVIPADELGKLVQRELEAAGGNEHEK